MSGWRYKREDGEVVGILSEDEIKHCAERGGISLNSPVMHEEMTKGEWVAASRIGPLRKRIEAIDQKLRELEASKASPMAGYVPPPQVKTPWARLEGIRQGVENATVSVFQKAAAVADYLTTKPTLLVCIKCEAEFAKFEVSGKCPLCGEWAVVMCEGCGFESSAKQFVENDGKCPRCGSNVSV